ncbi:MAG: hypothetical protein R2699_05830 [Acidimicrobiales bacterium]
MPPTDTQPSLRERKKARTRAALIEVSQRLFVERGYTETTSTTSGRQVEVTPQTCCAISSKAHLALAPMADPVEELRAFLEHPDRHLPALLIWREFVSLESAEVVEQSMPTTASHIANLRAFDWTDRALRARRLRQRHRAPAARPAGGGVRARLGRRRARPARHGRRRCPRRRPAAAEPLAHRPPRRLVAARRAPRRHRLRQTPVASEHGAVPGPARSTSTMTTIDAPAIDHDALRAKYAERDSASGPMATSSTSSPRASSLTRRPRHERAEWEPLHDEVTVVLIGGVRRVVHRCPAQAGRHRRRAHHRRRW